MKTLIRHGRIVTPEEVANLDLLIEGDHIAALELPGTIQDADNIVDASGCYVLPGLIDFHVHVDDQIGRFYLADTYESASRIAIQNGITTLCSFITQGQNESLGIAVKRALTKAEGKSHCDLHWHLTPTSFDEKSWREIEGFLEKGFRTFKFYTTYRSASIFSDYESLDRIFARLAPRGVRILVHCEDDELLHDSQRQDLSKASSHGLLRPAQAEAFAMERILDLARRHNAKAHIVHVSAVEGARLMAKKGQDSPVSSETCPHYLWLDETWLARPDGHRWICSPPLRNQREEFREWARNGAFEIFATDHCPFAKVDKDDWDGRDIRTLANGLPHLGALPHLVWRLHKENPDLAACEMALRLSANPARLAGYGHRKGTIRTGMDADLVLLNPYGPERPLRSSLSDVYESYPGFTSPLSFPAVFLRGRRLVQDGALLSTTNPQGRFLVGQGCLES